MSNNKWTVELIMVQFIGLCGPSLKKTPLSYRKLFFLLLQLRHCFYSSFCFYKLDYNRKLSSIDHLKCSPCGYMKSDLIPQFSPRQPKRPSFWLFKCKAASKYTSKQ